MDPADRKLPRTYTAARASGSKWYFTGKPCLRGHVDKRYAGNGACVTCIHIRACKWDHANPESRRQHWRKAKRKQRKSPFMRSCENIGRGLRRCLQNKNGRSWPKVLGYSRAEFLAHIESQFVGKMSWNNYGTLWEIDHKKPISRCRSVKEAWQLKNLQPLLISHNRSKGNRWDDDKATPRKRRIIK